MYHSFVSSLFPLLKVMLQFVLDGRRSSIKFDDCLFIENGQNSVHKMFFRVFFMVVLGV